MHFIDNKIFLLIFQVRRLGGAYGAKISPPAQVIFLDYFFNLVFLIK
jgi:hypothetical protein